MDFTKFLRLQSLHFIKVFLIIFILTTANSQLTSNDLNYIKKTILGSQSETGLFHNSIERTYQSVYVLKVLNEKIPEIPKICKEAQFQSMKEFTSALIKLNNLLKCKIEVNIEKKSEDEENLLDFDLNIVHEKILLWSHLENVNWVDLYRKIKSYVTDLNLFSDRSKNSESSLDANYKGLEILEILHKKIQDEQVKEEVKDTIVSVIQGLQGEFQLLGDNIGIFSRDNKNDFKTNSQFVHIFSKIHFIVKIENLEELNLKLMNYFLSFKYGFANTENIFYLIQAYDVLSNIPIIQLNKRVFDYIDEKSIQLKIVNPFNRLLDEYDVLIKYKVVSENSSENFEEKKEDAKDEFDLNEVEETKSEQTENSFKVEKTSRFILPLENHIKTPGKYILQLKAEFTNTSESNNQISDSKFELNYSLPFTAISKVKLNHLKIAITNSQDNLDDKEITIDYPKRNFKNFKATQNSVIKLKIKLNYGDNQFFKIEQIFLKLRHVEYGKTYSSYATRYLNEENYYYIEFDLSDTNNIEPYEGIYELTLIVSDNTFENPMFWNFGKIEIKFKKPLDPSNMTPSYKNIQKEKMETSVAHDESQNSKTALSLIFSSIVITLLSAFLIYLKQTKINVNNFPKPSDTFAFLFSVGLVTIIFLIAYVLFIFYLKLRIVQTLLAILVILIPGSLIAFKALSYISIEI